MRARWCEWVLGGYEGDLVSEIEGKSVGDMVGEG